MHTEDMTASWYRPAEDTNCQRIESSTGWTALLAKLCSTFLGLSTH